MKRVSYFILWGIVLLISSYVLYGVFNSKKEVGFIKLQEVFNSFEYKKIEETRLKNIESVRKKHLDSLELSYKGLIRRYSINKTADIRQELEVLEEKYALKKKEFVETNQAMFKSSNDKIWQSLNQYVKDFGKEKSYTLVFGAQGSGVLMYGEDDIDVTNEVIEYINNKYKGI